MLFYRDIYNVAFILSCQSLLGADCPFGGLLGRSENQSLALEMNGEDFCPQVARLVSMATPTLQSFQDQSRSIVETGFLVGQTAYFSIAVSSDTPGIPITKCQVVSNGVNVNLPTGSRTSLIFTVDDIPSTGQTSSTSALCYFSVTFSGLNQFIFPTTVSSQSVNFAVDFTVFYPSVSPSTSRRIETHHSTKLFPMLLDNPTESQRQTVENTFTIEKDASTSGDSGSASFPLSIPSLIGVGVGLVALIIFSVFMIRRCKTKIQLPKAPVCLPPLQAVGAITGSPQAQV